MSDDGYNQTCHVDVLIYDLLLNAFQTLLFKVLETILTYLGNI